MTREASRATEARQRVLIVAAVHPAVPTATVAVQVTAGRVQARAVVGEISVPLPHLVVTTPVVRLVVPVTRVQAMQALRAQIVRARVLLVPVSARLVDRVRAPLVVSVPVSARSVDRVRAVRVPALHARANVVVSVPVSARSVDPAQGSPVVANVAVAPIVVATVALREAANAVG